MSLLCKTGCRCCCNTKCSTTTVATAVEAETTTPSEVTVRAILPSVLDSCCTTEDVCREIKVTCPELFDPCELEVGCVVPVELDDDITFKEVCRKKDGCACVSSVKFNIPLRIYGTDGCHCDRYICRDVTAIRSVKLCCTEDSDLMTNNTRVLALSAVVTDICGEEITITVCLLFRSCVQQVIMREYSWLATPVCVSENCNDARKQLYDPCDMTCGCVSGKTCPSCE